VVGKLADIDSEPYTVVGVMPQGFVMPGSAGALWTTLRLSSAEIAAEDARMIQPIARLQPAVSLAQAQSALNVLAATFGEAKPGNHQPRRLRITAWHDEPDQTYKVTLWLALAMVSGLLIIACANLSSILLARAISRRRDSAIRLATGASRLQLTRQSLIEICLLALLALAKGSTASAISLNYIRDHLSALSTGIPNLARIEMNGRVLLFSFGVSLLAALISGLLPAISATSIDLSTGLRESGTHAGTGHRVRRLMHLLVSVETGISMMLLLTSGLLVRSLVHLASEDHGIRPDRVLTVRLPSGSWQAISVKRTPDEERKQIARYLDILGEAEAIRGVESAALASSLPLSHVSVSTRLLSPDEATTVQAKQIMPLAQAVTADYFRVMGIPLLTGRTFDARDARSAVEAVLVNEAFTRRYFQGENPVGKHLRSPDSKADTQIIGMVKDSPHLDYGEEVQPQIYRNFEQKTQTPFLTGLVVRTHGDPQRLLKDIRSNLLMGNPDQAVVQVRTLQNLVDENIWRPRFCAWLFSAFASIALSLASIGIYGVITYVTVSQKRDFGIRLALGADTFGLFRLATLHSMAPVLIGASLGVAGTFWASRFLTSLLYKTSPFDLTACLVSAAILFVLAFAATVGPALRICRDDSAATLRSE
jgi:putative ABC transport system permease protein